MLTARGFDESHDSDLVSYFGRHLRDILSTDFCYAQLVKSDLIGNYPESCKGRCCLIIASFTDLMSDLYKHCFISSRATDVVLHITGVFS